MVEPFESAFASFAFATAKVWLLPIKKEAKAGKHRGKGW